MQAKRKLFDCSEKGYALRLNQTDKLNNMHRETAYYNREVRNKSIGLILLLHLFFTFSGLERLIRRCATSLAKHARYRSHKARPRCVAASQRKT